MLDSSADVSDDGSATAGGGAVDARRSVNCPYVDGGTSRRIGASVSGGGVYPEHETSSHNSAKSEKNLADFVDEDESCEEELARLAQVGIY